MQGPGTTGLMLSGRLADGLLWLTSVLFVGVMSAVVTSSLASLIFSGPLEPFLPIGLTAGLTGAIVVNFLVGIKKRNGALVALPAAATTVILAISLSDLAAVLGSAPAEVFAASAALTLVGASFMTGILFFAAGVFRLGELARYIPYPVFAGFLGAVGLLIVLGAVEMAAQPAEAALLDASAVAYWLPAVVLGSALLAGTRIWQSRSLLPIAILVALVLFHAGRLMMGIEVDAAAAMGLLLVAPDSVALGLFPVVEIADRADVRAVLAQWPELTVLAVIALVAATLGASGIELSTGREIQLNRDLRITGLGNLLAAAGGGLAAYHNVGSTLLLHRMLGGASGRAGLGVSFVLAAVLAGGIDLLSLLPRAVSAAVLVYVGLDLIDQWVVSARRRLPRGDFAILVGIVAVGVTVGFLQAVAVGIVAATGLFIFNYARLDFVRASLDASLRQSTTERGAAAREALIASGAGVRIFELQGYVFFGAAHRLMRRLSGQLSGEGDRIRAIILDFHHTQGVDISAAIALAGLAKRCKQREVRLWLTDAGSGLDAMIRRADPAAAFLVAPTLDAALAAEEETLLTELPPARDLSELTLLMKRIEAAGHGDLFACEAINSGTELYRQGEPSDSLVLLEEGRMAALVTTDEGGALHVATILPGALVGEIGFFGGVARTATVVAEADSMVRIIRHPALAELSRRNPELGQAFLGCGAALLAHRLARANALRRQLLR